MKQMNHNQSINIVLMFEYEEQFSGPALLAASQQDYMLDACYPSPVIYELRKIIFKRKESFLPIYYDDNCKHSHRLGIDQDQEYTKQRQIQETRQETVRWYPEF